MTDQDRADAAEAAAIDCYLAMRSVWWPYWGANPRLREGPPKR